MPLSLQIMAMLTWKEMPCVENLQITYCVNCRNTNIPGYCCQPSVFCDCYRNTGHFLCTVERIKRLWTSICIASSTMFPLRQSFLIWSASTPRGCWNQFQGVLGKVTCVAVKGIRLSLLYPYSNQVLVNGRGCWTASASPKGMLR